MTTPETPFTHTPAETVLPPGYAEMIARSNAIREAGGALVANATRVEGIHDQAGVVFSPDTSARLIADAESRDLPYTRSDVMNFLKIVAQPASAPLFSHDIPRAVTDKDFIEAHWMQQARNNN